MTTDWKALCAELVRIADALDGGHALVSNQGQALDGFSALASFRDVARRARAALAEPEPERPTDEELDELAWNWYSKTGSTWYQIAAFRAFARAVLARWGRPAPLPLPADD